jgi:hypothetical protein
MPEPKYLSVRIEYGNDVQKVHTAREAVAVLAGHDLVSEACALQATSDAKLKQRCVMMQIEYLRPATGEDEWAQIGDMLPIETLTCLDPNDPELHSYIHAMLDEYLKYAHHAPAWNRFWIGGAECSYTEHKELNAYVHQADTEEAARAELTQEHPTREVLLLEQLQPGKWHAVLGPEQRKPKS